MPKCANCATKGQLRLRTHGMSPRRRLSRLATSLSRTCARRGTNAVASTDTTRKRALSAEVQIGAALRKRLAAGSRRSASSGRPVSHAARRTTPSPAACNDERGGIGWRPRSARHTRLNGDVVRAASSASAGCVGKCNSPNSVPLTTDRRCEAIASLDRTLHVPRNAASSRDAGHDRAHTSSTSAVAIGMSGGVTIGDDAGRRHVAPRARAATRAAPNLMSPRRSDALQTRGDRDCRRLCRRVARNRRRPSGRR